jgi:hypothetical protein
MGLSAKHSARPDTHTINVNTSVLVFIYPPVQKQTWNDAAEWQRVIVVISWGHVKVEAGPRTATVVVASDQGGWLETLLGCR